MRSTRSRGRLLLGISTAVALVLTACGGNGDDGTAAGTGEEAGEEAGDGGEAAAGPFTIGVSNGFTGSEWRTQMLDNIQEVFAEYEEQGLVDDLIIESDDVDEAGQIEQIRNLVNQGVDAIIINPNSPDALNAAFEEAAAEGVRIYAVDQAVTSEAVTNVVIDQAEWAKISARWLAEQLGEGAQIVGVNGIAGHPANEARWGGAQEVFEEAGIEVVAQGNANWSQAEGQTVMQELLGQHGDTIDGVWAQDGVAEGVLRALIDEDRLDLTTTGEARAGYLRLWDEAGIDTIGVVNPPGVGATALRFALLELQGEAIAEDNLENGNTLFLPLPDDVTSDELDEWLADVEGQPDGYSVDVILSEEEVRGYLQ
ncbi:substrate-binding domain-containing protein [Egicoccus sp. AB-alg2]|uniref:substrate-binding domain-containing protein n=1 Tax=Egicoccus sp. AB-alg2 TaxID=3242693 RepID=UPI00359E5998